MAQPTATTVAVAVPERKAFSFAPAWMAMASLTVFYILVNWYERTYALQKGTDYTSPVYVSYWLNWLYAEWVLEATTLAGAWGWLWATRDRHMERLAPDLELKRYFNLYLWALVYAFGIYWGASYFTEQDGDWHMTIIRDTDFTPSHIIEFYLTYPVYIIFGVTWFVYGRTRLPQFVNRFCVPWLIVVAGPLMILPNVGLNEFGHTAWIMEELFVAPLHWGFVFFGWAAIAFLGWVTASYPRVAELLGHIYFGKPCKPAAALMEDPYADTKAAAVLS
ncbi:methane monooxygenase/ammonia monooxygenase subunit C [Candidatus Methylacidithermus pantelleriae]|uniref:Particulate methane monooxygenase subunit C n=1 Tax=Candidatus Methylacidithermus pantelleriae TaxID=2744239 RepID=A0A8J2BMZ4_9BACT|nr:methane monooxygenase/ammonia monooxygenase subunit C [Candidatus Methylacidithermus pantelleriae]CAF0703666.1 Particulate methane monooxygenase subunit C [Candidatus Methylacidithermus pantelleriae]